MNFETSRRWQGVAHRLVPGGCHTYAKGDDQYPVLAPAAIARGRGSHVWDADGNEFIEYGMGLRAVTLGHGFGPVVEAVREQVMLGTNFTRPALIELECAEAVLGVIEGGEMVKFAKNGSDITTAAVKLARAFTGRDLVAICADQPFFSTDDWFIGSTPMYSGIPAAVRDLTVKFRYNDLDSLREVFHRNPGRIACVVMEAETTVEPAEGYLQGVRSVCDVHGALLVLDEMLTGFRWHLGGAQAFHGVTPDLSCFGKAMANGFSVAALVGRREIMELGGLRHDRERVFLLSTTHGAETHSLAAAIKTIQVYSENRIVEHLWEKGTLLAERLTSVSRELGLEEHFSVLGRPCNLVYATRDQDLAPSQAFRALFLQETIRRGLLMPSLVISYSHTDEDIARTVEAVGESLLVYRKALEDGVEHHLVGRPVKPVFRTYN